MLERQPILILMPKPKRNPREVAAERTRDSDIGQRLEIFRVASGYETKVSFIRHTGIGKSALSDWENGQKHLGLKSAIKLCAAYPELTLDWLYLGRLGSITDVPLRNKIRDEMQRRRIG